MEEMMEEKYALFCAYDTFNPTVVKETGEVVHVCKDWGSVKCLKCESRYDGEKIREYMNTHERIEAHNIARSED